MFHVMNAWEEAGAVLADVIRYDSAPLFPRRDGRPVDPRGLQGTLCRWRFPLDGSTDRFDETPLDDLGAEFPRIDDRRAGLPYRHGYVAARIGAEPGSADFDTIAGIDHQTGRRSLYRLPGADRTSEPVFVPRSADAPEGEGWLLATIWRGEEQASELAILDAGTIEAGPVATIRLPQRVPFGFHGSWVGARP
jgi:carotenoid cleavage dioxygenase